MSHIRQASEAPKTPHAVSLKVLRLSKPQLAFQFPLPAQTSSSDLQHLDPRAALSYPPTDVENESVLSPLLTLPPSFGSVHVGETFSCTLCANNELPKDAVDGVRITAVMHTPSNPDGVALPLFASHRQAKEAEEAQAEVAVDESTVSLGKGETLARMVRFDLREDGQHVLAVTVTYAESLASSPGDENKPRSKPRTFRKLYQFPAQQLLSVRTKAQMLPPRGSKASEFILEAQLENLGESTVALEPLSMMPSEGLVVKGLNTWDMEDLKQHDKSLTLDPKQVLQCCYLFIAASDAEIAGLTKEGRVMLGQLSIDWRGTMGEKGSLSTGTLGAKHRKF